MANFAPIIETLAVAAKPLYRETAETAVKLSIEAMAEVTIAAKNLTPGFSRLGGAIGRHSGGPVESSAVNRFGGGPVEFSQRAQFQGIGNISDRPALDIVLPGQDGIPNFMANGFLPPGIHRTPYEAFASHFGSNEHRVQMLNKVEPMLRRLADQGQERVYLAGSFVTHKPFPKDIDMLVHTNSSASSSLQHVLNDLRGIRFGETMTAAKSRFGVDLMQGKAAEGLNCKHLKLFKTNKADQPIGIIDLKLR
ncbi:hypothetical protein BH11CYA1_BH11CYA1_11900 [soil metagenome]